MIYAPVTGNSAMYYEADKEYNTSETKKMSKDEVKAYGDYNGKMRAEHDVETMTEYQKLRADKPRCKKAIHCAKMKQQQLAKAVKEK